MAHSYQLVWHDYFPNEVYFEFCRNREGINRNNGHYFIYYVYLQDIGSHISVSISSQSIDTKILLHTCIFNHCTSHENNYTSGCLYLSEILVCVSIKEIQYWHIIPEIEYGTTTTTIRI